MAIALDSNQAGVSGAASPATWSHTCTGTNLVLFVAITTDNTNTDVVTAVTYNGVAMIRLQVQLGRSGGSEYLYYLVGPATGAHTVSVTTSSHLIYTNSISYTGASQSAYTNSVTSSATSAITETLSGVATGSWTLLCGWFNGGAVSAGTGSTQRQSGVPFVGDSNGTVSGSVSMSWNGNSGQVGNAIMVEIPMVVVPTSTQEERSTPSPLHIFSKLSVVTIVK